MTRNDPAPLALGRRAVACRQDTTDHDDDRPDFDAGDSQGPGEDRIPGSCADCKDREACERRGACWPE
jgi:hypothetical protein